MDTEEYRRHLESCLHHEQSKDKQDAEAISQMLNEFASDMKEVVEASGKLKIGFVKKARAILDSSRSQVIANRVRVNEQLQRSVIRITCAVIAVYAAFSGLILVKTSIDKHFCEFYNVEGRTQRYETQKPCKR